MISDELLRFDIEKSGAEAEDFGDVVVDFVLFRMNTMAKHFGSFGGTRHAFFLQLELLAEFALLGMPNYSDEQKSVYTGVFDIIPGIATEEERELSVDSLWASVAVSAASTFIAMEMRRGQEEHDAHCPNCAKGGHHSHAHKMN